MYFFRVFLISALTTWAFPSFAQSTDQSVMRMVCFDASETVNGQSTGGWTAVITQMNNDQYPASTFIPDQNDDYAEKFPMFENIIFFLFVFEQTDGISTASDPEALAEDLLRSGNTPVPILAEGNRVGSFLDLSWSEASSFQFDSADQSKNLYVDPANGVERVPVCQPPFAFVVPSSG